MEGLQVTETNLKSCINNRDFRIDAEFHEPLPPENVNLKWDTIGKHLLATQYGISIEMNEEGEGFPIYRMNEIENMFCAWETQKYASVTPLEAEPFVLKSRDVLFNRTNSQKFVGRTGLYLPFTEEKRIFASYLVRLIPNEESLLAEYLVTYLNSSRGVRDIKRRARISINQSNVNPEEVKAIRIPILGKGFQLRIRSAFETAHTIQKEASAAIGEAEVMLTEALGLSDWQPTEPLTYTRRASEAFIAARLDAEYFHPKFTHLISHIANAGSVVPLGDVLSFCERGKQPAYADTGLPVVNSKHVRMGSVLIDNDNRYAKAEDETLIIVTGDVLMNGTGVGTIGRVAPYLHKQSALPDNHVTVLRLADGMGIDPVFLAVQLGSLVGQLQVEQYFKGSSGQIELYPQDIKKFAVWRAPDEVQLSIREQIESAGKNRERAISLLDAAKRAVEIAIEDSELAAIAYLKDQGV